LENGEVVSVITSDLIDDVIGTHKRTCQMASEPVKQFKL